MHWNGIILRAVARHDRDKNAPVDINTADNRVACSYNKDWLLENEVSTKRFLSFLLDVYAITRKHDQQGWQEHCDSRRSIRPRLRAIYSIHHSDDFWILDPVAESPSSGAQHCLCYIALCLTKTGSSFRSPTIFMIGLFAARLPAFASPTIQIWLIWSLFGSSLVMYKIIHMASNHWCCSALLMFLPSACKCQAKLFESKELRRPTSASWSRRHS